MSVGVLTSQISVTQAMWLNKSCTRYCRLDSSQHPYIWQHPLDLVLACAGGGLKYSSKRRDIFSYNPSELEEEEDEELEENAAVGGAP